MCIIPWYFRFKPTLFVEKRETISYDYTCEQPSSTNYWLCLPILTVLY